MAKSAFMHALEQRRSTVTPRSWIYVPYDQLNATIGPLSRLDPSEAGIVMVEAPWKAARRPYHKQKLATVLTAGRHFALEQAERGVAVRFFVSEGSYAAGLRKAVNEVGPLTMMEAAERELRVDVAPLVHEKLMAVVPHEGWLTTHEQFRSFAGPKPPWRMDVFYRGVRKATGILMDRKLPEGGRFSFDTDNRQRWRGSPPAPRLPTFDVDAITEEVCELVARTYSDHPGELHPETIPASAHDARRLWEHALRKCLPSFGPYEDAMARDERTLFHTCISALLNLHRLLPRDVIDDVLAAELPLASKEGFVRQVLGWREYMRHVHLATDGFRVLPHGRSAPESDAAPSHLGASEPLPAAYWGKPSGFACLDTVVADVWRDAYSHHITRLMVLSNIAQLLDVSPRELTDWFWIAYVDAYDWVVEPNVLAMSTYGVGDLATTKPYVSGAAYIHRMSDYCGTCAFDPKKSCPLTRMYWAYLARHADKLGANPRIAQPVHALAKRRAEDKALDARVFERVRELLAAGHPVRPTSLPSPS